MSKYSKGNRVFAFEGEYKGKSGEVIDYQNIEFGMQKGCIVKLDEDSSTVCIPERDLEVENLNLEDINIEITNLKTQLKELAHQIPEKIAKEIPEHLAYLQEALKSKSKSEFLNEYHYISKELERTVNPDFVDSNISLKKLQHHGKNLPEL
ncbi:hypothetical protein [Nostoc sp. UHCC 0251]|uniref:hypothetical protein n=1 Tax=Nostoc sp. UHCC 0251 TaxID=3110240 RepID=UPI002B20393A|nr:hypothetical protein [Nostoc sp. UHCC 0251]MEA5626895.1 hypothetical protein [Nostoc sp. UHCC 0251]